MSSLPASTVPAAEPAPGSAAVLVRPGSARPVPARPDSLGSEVRESLLLLSFAVAVTVGLTTAAQAALAVLA